MGKNTYETEDALMTEYGKQSSRGVHRAGRRETIIDCKYYDRHGSAAGRSGLGAVMGSKKLKALVARGTLEVPLADKVAVTKLRMEHIKSWQTPERSAHPMHQFGTSAGAYNAAHSGDSPVKNWGV